MSPPLNVRLDLRRFHHRDTAPIPRRHEPVTVGLPFPRGALRALDTLQMIDAAGQPVALQSRPLDRWSDGSIRWALFDFRADAPTGESTYTLQEFAPSSSDARAISPAIAISETSDRVEIDSGAAQFTCSKGGPLPFSKVVVQGESVLGEPSGLTVLDATGTPCDVDVTSVAVEERGPLRSTIVMAGAVRARDGNAILELRCRVHVFAGSPAVRLQLCLRNPRAAEHKGNFWDLGDAGSVLLKDASLVWTLADAAGAVHVSCSPERAMPLARVSSPFELYQDSSGGEHWKSRNHVNRHHQVPLTFRGYRVTHGRQDADAASAEGLRATPIVTLASGTRRIAVTMRAFWENFPKAIDVADRTLALRLFPRQFQDVFEIQGGEQKTHEIVVSFGDDGVSDVPLAWARDPLVAHATPAWYCSTQAVPFLVPAAEDPHRSYFSIVDAAIEGDDTFVHKREVIDQYGWRHFGDVYGDHENAYFEGEKPIVSHYNNQYDVIAGFAYQFFRSGDLRWWQQMIDLAAHVIDIDVYHTDRDKTAFNRGLFWHTYHYGDADTATHRTYPRAGAGAIHGGGPSADHNYTTGLLLHWFLTGDPWSRETAIDLARYVIDIDDGRKTVFRFVDRGRTGLATASGSYSYHGPGRSPANSLNALIDGHRLTGDRAFLDKADEIVRRVVHPRANIEALDLLDAENKWFYTMFFQSLGKYLLSLAEAGRVDASFVYARESLLHFARWMAAHEVPTLDRPERLHFPTETWAAQDIRKSDVLYHASAHAQGEERARFRERARFFFDHSIETLGKMPTRTYARPVIVLLTSGLLHAWFQRNPAFQVKASDASAAAHGALEFARPTVFVPQKQRVKRRLIALAAGAGLLAAAGVLRLLIS